MAESDGDDVLQRTALLIGKKEPYQGDCSDSTVEFVIILVVTTFTAGDVAFEGNEAGTMRSVRKRLDE